MMVMIPVMNENTPSCNSLHGQHNKTMSTETLPFTPTLAKEGRKYDSPGVWHSLKYAHTTLNIDSPDKNKTSNNPVFGSLTLQNRNQRKQGPAGTAWRDKRVVA